MLEIIDTGGKQKESQKVLFIKKIRFSPLSLWFKQIIVIFAKKPVINIKLQKPKKMKKLSFVFVAFAFVGLIALNSCKSSTQPAATQPAAVQEAAPVADSTAAPVADTSAVEE